MGTVIPTSLSGAVRPVAESVVPLKPPTPSEPLAYAGFEVRRVEAIAGSTDCTDETIRADYHSSVRG